MKTQDVRAQKRWDKYFYKLCNTISTKSPCLSRSIGAILVRDKSIISTGYNGPPRNIPHCGHDRLLKDNIIYHELQEVMKFTPRGEIGLTCPRQLLPSYVSGQKMELCTAVHAEENCISNAARIGTMTFGSTIYLNSVIPCHRCFSSLINAGIKEIVVEEKTYYDKHTKFLRDNSDIKIREFNL